MALIGSILVDGIAYAMVLFMIAIGLSLTMGLMRVVNMAHGVFAMMGGFFAAVVPRALGLPFELGVVLALAAVALASLPLERLLIRRFYRRHPLDQMLMTTGVMFLGIAAVNLVFGATPQAVPMPDYMTGSVDLGFRLFPRHRIAVILLGISVATILWFAIERSAFGMQVRAAVDNAPVAQAMGIDTARLYAVTFAAGAALAALGGIAGAELLPMEPSYAAKYLTLILAVVAVGGEGSLIGTFVAALLLGLLETAAKYLLPEISSIVFFIAMAVVLMRRPDGLFGRART